MPEPAALGQDPALTSAREFIDTLRKQEGKREWNPLRSKGCGATWLIPPGPRAPLPALLLEAWGHRDSFSGCWTGASDEITQQKWSIRVWSKGQSSPEPARHPPGQSRGIPLARHHGGDTEAEGGTAWPVAHPHPATCPHAGSPSQDGEQQEGEGEAAAKAVLRG